MTASVVVLASVPFAQAEVYQVGPGRTYTQLNQVRDGVTLQPGDVIEVDGGAVYEPSHWWFGGATGSPLTIRGRRVNGARPILSGGFNSIELHADHIVFEGFEVTGGSSRCVYHHGDDIKIRDVYIHDCPAHGLVSADTDSGSLTFEYSEVVRAGGSWNKHSIYVTSDQNVYPGSVFRMRFNYVHDGNSGHAVKSRFERNEIYYNWIEGARYHLLELIGPDEDAVTPPLHIREDSDVVGNVLIHKAYTPAMGEPPIDGLFAFVRAGSDILWTDGWNSTRGRYRFVNNTFLRTAPGYSSAVFRMFGFVESIEMSNNVFFNSASDGAPLLMRMDSEEFQWVAGEQISGQSNWVETGSSLVPSAWTGTITGANPRFANLAALDLRPAPGSPLLDAGTNSPTGMLDFPFPGPLFPPPFEPSLHAGRSMAARRRPIDTQIDIGAYERPPLLRRN